VSCKVAALQLETPRSSSMLRAVGCSSALVKQTVVTHTRRTLLVGKGLPLLWRATVFFASLCTLCESSIELRRSNET